MNNQTDDEILQELNRNKISEYGPAIAYTAVFIVVGVLGNSVSIVFYGRKVHKTTTNRLIMYLAVTDLIACVMFFDEIIELCFTINYKAKIACKFMYFLNHFIVVISFCILGIICIDRYRKICRPLQWQLTFTKIKLAIAGVVLFGLVISVSSFVILDIVKVNITVPISDRTIEAFYCTHTKDPDLITLVTISNLIDLLVFIVVVTSLAVLYTIVAWKLWQHQKKQMKSNLCELHHDTDVVDDETSTTTAVSPSSISVEKTTTSSSEQKQVKRHVEGVVKSDGGRSTTDTDKGQLQPASDEIGTGLDFSTDGLKSPKLKELNASCDDDKMTVKIGREDAHPEGVRSDLEKKKHQQTKKIKKSAKKHRHIERNVTVMMIVITVASILSYVPYFVVNLTLKRTSKTPEQEFDVLVQIALRSFIINNAINPYIIGIFNHEYRRFVKTSLRNAMCCGPFCFRR